MFNLNFTFLQNIKNLINPFYKNKDLKFIFKKLQEDIPQNKIAARIPGDKNLLHFLKLVNKPILSTSANLSGEITCRNIQEIKTIFDGKIFGAYDAPLGDEKKPSRILDLINNEYIR